MNSQSGDNSPPSDELIQLTSKAQCAFINEVNLLAKEGVPLACILTGLGLTAADLIACRFNPNAVAPWFEKQASIVREHGTHLGKPD